MSGYFLFLAENILISSSPDIYKIEIEKAILKAIEMLEKGDITDLSFSSGIAGLAWTLNLLSMKKVVCFETKDLFDDFEQILMNQLYRHLKVGNFDTMYGALGISKCFIQTKNFNALELIVKYLLDTKIESSNGVAWQTMVDGKACFNFSFAHGITGIAFFLSKCIEVGVSSEIVTPMLKGVVPFLLNSMDIDKTPLESFFQVILA